MVASDSFSLVEWCARTGEIINECVGRLNQILMDWQRNSGRNGMRVWGGWRVSPHGGTTIVRWTRRVGLGSVLPLALPVSPSVMTDASVAHVVQKADLLDSNTATAEPLKALPGIGDAYSEKIIKGRPCQRKDELAQEKILPRATYEGINCKIVAKQQEYDQWTLSKPRTLRVLGGQSRRSSLVAARCQRHRRPIPSMSMPPLHAHSVPTFRCPRARWVTRVNRPGDRVTIPPYQAD